MRALLLAWLLMLSAGQIRHLQGRSFKEAATASTARWPEIAERLAAECHPHQEAGVRDPALRWARLVGRGGGKTTMCRARLLRRAMLTPKAQCLYIATTRSQCEDLMWEPLHEINDRFGLGCRFREVKHRMEFANGSWIQLAGADNKREIEKYRGIPFHEVIIDESGSYPPDLLERLIYRVIEPRLGDFGGSLGMVGTPSHILMGPFYEVTRPGSEADGWSSGAWTLRDAAAQPGPWQDVMRRLWEAALVAKEKNGWSDSHPVWRREYLGLWAADDTEMVFRYRPHDDEGRPLNQWDPPRDRRGMVILPPGDWQYVYAMDEGYRDPFALNIFAFNAHDGQLLHVFGHEQRGMYAAKIAELLLGPKCDASSPAGLIGATGWPAFIVGDIGEGLQAELRNVYGIPVDRADKKANYKHDAIELTNGDFIDGRIKILKGSALEEQLQTLQWAVDDYGHLKENKGQANHSTDTLIYARQRALHPYTEPRPEPGPTPGSIEDREQWADESLRKLLGRGQSPDESSWLASIPGEEWA